MNPLITMCTKNGLLVDVTVFITNRTWKFSSSYFSGLLIFVFELVDSNFNPIQAGLFWNHIGWGGTLCPPSVSPLFVIQLPLNLAC